AEDDTEHGAEDDRPVAAAPPRRLPDAPPAGWEPVIWIRQAELTREAEALRAQRTAAEAEPKATTDPLRFDELFENLAGPPQPEPDPSQRAEDEPGTADAASADGGIPPPEPPTVDLTPGDMNPGSVTAGDAEP